MPESMSDAIAGAPAKAAVVASTKLNMNATKISTCDTPRAICNSSEPFARARLTSRSTPQPVTATLASVSSTRTARILRRTVSRSVRIAMVITPRLRFPARRRAR
jgi:hypothetical protein